MQLNYEVRLNFKVRAKNPQFWFQIGLSVFAPISAYHGLSGIDIDSWPKLGDLLLSALSNPFIVFSALVGIFNAITDPTTPGFSDSNRAMKYRSTKDSRKLDSEIDSDEQAVG